MDIDTTRLDVMDYGKSTADMRKVEDVQTAEKYIEFAGYISMELLWQIERDRLTGYKFWDALSMWLGQPFNDNDKAELVKLAEAYCNGEV